MIPLGRRYKEERSKSKSRKRDNEVKASSSKGKDKKRREQSCDRSPKVRDAHPKTSKTKAEPPPSKKRTRENDHTPARIYERDLEPRSRSPALIRSDDSQGPASALLTLNPAQKQCGVDWALKHPLSCLLSIPRVLQATRCLMPHLTFSPLWRKAEGQLVQLRIFTWNQLRGHATAASRTIGLSTRNV